MSNSTFLTQVLILLKFKGFFFSFCLFDERYIYWYKKVKKRGIFLDEKVSSFPRIFFYLIDPFFGQKRKLFPTHSYAFIGGRKEGTLDQFAPSHFCLISQRKGSTFRVNFHLC